MLHILQASEDPVATVSAAATASPFTSTPPPPSDSQQAAASSSSERNPSIFEKKFRLGKTGEGFKRFE